MLKLENPEVFFQQIYELKSHYDYSCIQTIQLSKEKQKFLLYSVHHRYRLPWVLKGPSKANQHEKLLASLRPEKEITVTIEDQQLVSFLKNTYDERKNIIKNFASNEKLLQKTLKEFHFCEMTLATALSSFVIPSIFGFFVGTNNMNDFIEAIGIAMDEYHSDTEQFLLTFDKSFICLVLRDFFFSPVLKEYLSEHSTLFYDFYISYTKRKDDQVNITRFQRLLSTFFNELSSIIGTAPSYIHLLFERIMTCFGNKQSILVVIINCLLIPMISYPTVFGILPSSTQYIPETPEMISTFKQYCYNVCSLPLGNQSDISIKSNERLDEKIIVRLIESLLNSSNAIRDPIFEISTICLPAFFVKSLAEINGNPNVLKILKALDPEIIIFLEIGHVVSPNVFPGQPRLQNTFNILSNLHPKAYSNPTAVQRAFCNSNNMDSIIVIEKLINNEISKFKDFSIVLLSSNDTVKYYIELTQSAIINTESIIVTQIANSIFKDTSFSIELEKKKMAFMSEKSLFYNFFVGYIDSYTLKNPWVTPLIPHIAKMLHSKAMSKMPFSLFRDNETNLQQIDQLFLSKKMDLLTDIQKNSMDPCSAKLISSPNTIASALHAVLRACLYENPIESAKEIVLSLSTIEGLFSFEFNAPPEANQLMPLLANLFIMSPVPNPITFGKWICHYFEPFLEGKPEWFYDTNFRSLEHYFQFNNWMGEMIVNFENSS